MSRRDVRFSGDGRPQLLHDIKRTDILKQCGASSNMLTGGANGQPVGQYISTGTRIAETMTTQVCHSYRPKLTQQIILIYKLPIPNGMLVSAPDLTVDNC